MAELDLEAIRQLCAAASPGPWEVEYDRCDCGGGYPCTHGEFPYALRGPVRVEPLGDFAPSEISEMLSADVEFVAAARTAVPALLAELDQAKAETAKAYSAGEKAIAALLARVDRLTEALRSIAYEGGECLAVEAGAVSLSTPSLEDDEDDGACGVCAVCWAREALEGTDG
jgi:hypothetical protein